MTGVCVLLIIAMLKAPSLPINACLSETNIPFPLLDMRGVLANHVTIESLLLSSDANEFNANNNNNNNNLYLSLKSF